jgi:hypothetical protein
MRKEGLEPPYPSGYQILSLARLPVPPLSRLSSLPRLRSAAVPSFGEAGYSLGDLQEALSLKAQARRPSASARHGRGRLTPNLTEFRTDLFHGLFVWQRAGSEPGRLARHSNAPTAVPDPATGRLLKVASVEISDRAVCPACTQLGAGGYVSFESDLRLAFACPSCRTLVWIAGA